jgi:CRP-like cAMP-binding protein
LSAAAILARVPLFAGLSADDLAGLATGLRARQYARGEVVFLAGDPGSSLCIVQSGRVRLGFSSPDGRERSLALLGPGDFFGELALLDGRPRSADAVAAEPSRLLLLPRESFLQSLRSHPELAITLLGVLSERLRRDAQLLQDAAFLDVPGRLAGTLLRLAEPAAEGGENAGVIPGRLSVAELATLVGATRESVSRWLSAFERGGLIRRQAGRIALLQPDELRRRTT